MAADASIYSQLRQQALPEGPLENYMKMMSVKQLMGANDLQGLQMEQARLGLQDDQATRTAYQQSGGDLNRLRALLSSGGQYKQAQAIDKVLLDTEAKRAAIDKDKATTRKENQATELQAADRLAGLYGGVLSAPPEQKQQAYLAAIDQAKSIFHPDHAMLQNLPAQYPGDDWAKRQLDGTLSYKDRLEAQDRAAGRVESARHNKVTEGQGAQRIKLEGANLAESRRHHGVSEQMENVKVDPYGVLGINKSPAPAAAAGSNLSGDAYLATLPPGVASQVKALADGKLAITPRTLQSPQGAALLQMAMQYEPGTDQTTYVSRQATARDAASGKLSISNNALNTVTGHLAGLADAAEKLNNTPFPWANKVKNFALSATGDPRINAFNLNLHGVADELERAYRGAGGSAGAIKEWQESLGDASSPEQFKATLAKGAEMLQSKLEANHAQYVQGMHGKPGDFKTITPKTEAALARLRGEKPTEAAPAAAAPQFSQADIDAELRRRKVIK